VLHYFNQLKAGHALLKILDSPFGPTWAIVLEYPKRSFSANPGFDEKCPMVVVDRRDGFNSRDRRGVRISSVSACFCGK